MKTELFSFQKTALFKLRLQTAEAMWSYGRTHTPQVVSFTAPTGAGKTIILATLIESIYYGDEQFPEQPEAIFVWLSDSPQLNEQSRLKIDLKADKIALNQCVTISEDSFDQELLDDGRIYFLNTQKLGKGSKLTKHSDSRQYTIWETLANTAREKNDRLYIIIDEAHRGMLGREAGKATTIMQKFLKGSAADRMETMPLVLGMSATPERFNRLVEGTTSTIHRVVVTSDEVRNSGLLKDRIVITYPDEQSIKKDMAVLQAAADDWKQKWEHWNQYCYEQHYAQVNPVFVVQVLNGSSGRYTDTDLDDCLSKIETRTGFQFKEGEVVHTFGQTASAIEVGGLKVRYEEPVRIAEDKNIKVVFFKENLSTGWDCPRAETMVSFRRAKDATYIAQLLGRMVRTPMQMRIQVDDILNDVHLYLPYFDAQTVNEVVEALRSAEGGDIPTDVHGESIEETKFDTLTVKAAHHRNPSSSNGRANSTPALDLFTYGSGESDKGVQAGQPLPLFTQGGELIPTNTQSARVPQNSISSNAAFASPPDEKPLPTEDLFDRMAVMKFINQYGLLSYEVRSVRICNYLASLYKMARLLVQSGLNKTISKDIAGDIVNMLHAHTEELKASGKYDDLVEMVLQFKLRTQIFDVFGETVDNHLEHDLFTTTDTDIDRQLRSAESKLGSEGIANEYGKQHYDETNPNGYKIDVIIFAADDACYARLLAYAKEKFHSLNDEYRRRIARLDSEKLRRQYDSIVSDGDIVSKHCFRLPETIQIPHEDGGKAYRNHLFVDAATGVASIKLNTWEADLIAEEEKDSSFVCWLRNPPRKPWALCIPYEINGEIRPTYPDFIIIRKDEIEGFVMDILEPHNPAFSDNLGKAKGFAEYARQNAGVGRMQLIRQSKDIAGRRRFLRLDMSQSAVREKVVRVASNEELDRIFETDGFFD